MPLAKPWKELDRKTVARAPDRIGVYELGDGEGTVLAVDSGVLADELKTAFVYGKGERVRWEATGSRERAAELVADHRDRLDS